MLMKQIIEAYDVLDSSYVTGETVEEYLRTIQPDADITVYELQGPKAVSYTHLSLFFGNSSFGEADNNLLLLLLAVATENREYLEKPEEIDPMYLRSFLAFYIADTVEHAELPDISDMPQLPDERADVYKRQV